MSPFLALALFAVAAPTQTAPTFDDVVYATFAPGEPPLTLDLYIPTSGTAPWPVVIRIHGGKWEGGVNEPIPAPYFQLLSQGFAIASPRYRFTTQGTQYPVSGVIFPAQAHDVKGVVRWLRANAATYNLDPKRIAARGESAGGHLAALLGVSGGDPALEGSVGGNLGFSSAVQAVVDFYGPTDLLWINDDVTTPPGSALDHDAPDSPESKLVGWSAPGQGLGDIKANLNNPSPPYPQLLALVAQASPLSWAGAGDVPFFVAHGTNDLLVPIAQSSKLVAALGAAGVSVQWVPVPGAGHGFDSAPTEQAAAAFLVSRLGKPWYVYVPALSTSQPNVGIGAPWTFRIDAPHPGGFWMIFTGTPAAPSPIPPFGTLYLDPFLPLVEVASGALPPTSSVLIQTLAIPNDPFLAGTSHFLQSLAGGGPIAPTKFALTNLLKVTIF